MRFSWLWVGGGLVGLALAAVAPSISTGDTPAAPAAPAPTAPVNKGQSALETRALEDFTNAQYATALPELQKVADQLKDQPDRLGLIQEDIRVCQKQLADAAAAPAAAPGGDPNANGGAPPAPQDGPPTADQRKPHAPPQAGEVREMAIKELGNFEYDPEKGGNIPADVQALSGMQVRLHGFMIPMDQAASITTFALVPSLFACCFGQPPQIQHTIVVHVPKGKAVSYFPDEINVEGKLTVSEKKEDGFIVSIFELDCSSVRPAAK